MINQHFYIARLIARYLSDEIEEEEQAEQRRAVSIAALTTNTLIVRAAKY